MDIKVRKAKESDALRINEVNRDSWANTYVNEKLGIDKEYLLDRKKITDSIVEKTESYIKDSQVYFVIEVDGVVRGFSSPRIDEKGRNRLGAMYIEPSFTGMGLGQKLMDKVLDFYGKEADIYLEVADYNENAISFYRKNDFEIIDEIPRKKHFLDEERYIPIITMVRKGSSKN